ncbi:unnamed protein product [Toxocara canis]|uniref:Uncharacterized protein n=1 Tax=Toxocara canis TaxID=6265 RepID=A0A183UDJ1_TOXCA|nr:unnamed protein product [Toxocara canis]
MCMYQMMSRQKTIWSRVRLFVPRNMFFPCAQLAAARAHLDALRSHVLSAKRAMLASAYGAAMCPYDGCCVVDKGSYLLTLPTGLLSADFRITLASTSVGCCC